jgi:hypothetical protein
MRENNKKSIFSKKSKINIIKKKILLSKIKINKSKNIYFKLSLFNDQGIKLIDRKFII